MKQEIPHIPFQPGNTSQKGFEIISVDKIRNRKGSLDHNPESPHQLLFYNLIYFTEGQGRHFVDFTWYPVQANSIVYLTKDQINAFDFTGSLNGYCIVFTQAYFVECFSNLPDHFIFRLFNPQITSPILPLPQTSDFDRYFNLLHAEYQRPEGFNQAKVLQALFTILLSKAESIKQHQTLHLEDTASVELFLKFTQLLTQQFTHSRKAMFYARELAITYKHLNDTCQKLIRKSAKQVIDDYVVLQAKRRLINSSIKSTELAFDLGFDEPTNFTKYFKNHTGFTPKAFKNSLLT